MVWVLERSRESSDILSTIRPCFWTEIGDSEHFSLQVLAEVEEVENCFPFHLAGTQSCLVCSEQKYRIIYKNEIPMVIAKANTEEDISPQWEFVLMTLDPAVSMLDQENENEEEEENVTEQAASIFGSFFTKALELVMIEEPKSPCTKKNHSKLYSEQRNFIQLKVAAMIKDAPQFQSRLQILFDLDHFRSFFPNFTTEETPVLLEECGMWENQYFSGVCCLTNHFFFFISVTSICHFWIRLKEISDITMKEGAYLEELSFQLRQGLSISIVELDHMEHTLELCRNVWKTAVRVNIKDQEKNVKMQKLNTPRRAPKILPDLADDSLENVTSHVASAIREERESQEQSDFLLMQPLFTNAALESLIEAETTFYRSRNVNARTRKGILQVSITSIHFCSYDRKYVVTIPFRDILKIKKKPLYTIKIVLREKSKPIFMTFAEAREERDISLLIFQFYQSSDEAMISSSELLSELMLDAQHQNLREGPQDVGPDMGLIESMMDREREERRHGEWMNYFEYFGCGSTVIRTYPMLELIHKGVPNCMRPFVWQISSGSYYCRVTENVPYSHYLKKAIKCRESEDTHKHVWQHKEYFVEIKKDIQRSCDHPFYQTEEGLVALNNVLSAYSWCNPVIGYCQGMNIICSLFLLYLNEEDSFFLLRTLVEDILPGYFSKSMIGSLVDLQVVDELVKRFLPQLYERLLETVGGVTVIVVSWFMCLFIHCLPWKSTLRCIDFILAEGSRAIFLITLAILQTIQAEVLLLDELENDILEYVKERIHHLPYSEFEFNITAFFDVITPELITQLRAVAKPNLLAQLSFVSEATKALEADQHTNIESEKEGEGEQVGTEISPSSDTAIPTKPVKKQLFPFKPQLTARGRSRSIAGLADTDIEVRDMIQRLKDIKPPPGSSLSQNNSVDSMSQFMSQSKIRRKKKSKVATPTERSLTHNYSLDNVTPSIRKKTSKDILPPISRSPTQHLSLDCVHRQEQKRK